MKIRNGLLSFSSCFAGRRPYITVWFTDPDGYGLCFQWPTTEQTHDRWAADYEIEPKTFA